MVQVLLNRWMHRGSRGTVLQTDAVVDVHRLSIGCADDTSYVLRLTSSVPRFPRMSDNDITTDILGLVAYERSFNQHHMPSDFDYYCPTAYLSIWFVEGTKVLCSCHGTVSVSFMFHL